MIAPPPTRSLRHRAALAALLLPLALTACGGEATAPSAAPSSAPSTAPSTAPVSPAPTGGVQAPSQAADEEDADVVTLTVAGGKVTGDTGRVPVKLGDRVRLTVTSDVADEIHVHGYDLYVDTTPGQAAQTEFVADKPGIYAVEFHDSGLLLTRLQVQ